jgi:hypothetical protein
LLTAVRFSIRNGASLLTSKLSPQHRMTPRPPSRAALVLLATN